MFRYLCYLLPHLLLLVFEQSSKIGLLGRAVMRKVTPLICNPQLRLGVRVDLHHSFAISRRGQWCLELNHLFAIHHRGQWCFELNHSSAVHQRNAKGTLGRPYPTTSSRAKSPQLLLPLRGFS